METKYIQEFLELAEWGSSYAAAENLFISQSSLVRHIQALEKEFGTEFFERTRRGFVLNDNGRIFMSYAKRIALTQAECDRMLHPEKREDSGIRICSECKTIDLAVDFKKEHPEYSVEYLNTDDPIEHILTGELSCAFLKNVITVPRGITAVRFYREDVLVMVYRGHPFYDRDSVRLEELRGQKFVALTDDRAIEGAVAEALARIGFVRDNTARVLNSADLVRMVREKIGIAVIHGNPNAPLGAQDLRCIPIEPRIQYDVDLCFRSDLDKNSAAASFVAFARKWIIRHKNINLSLID